jgi:hypothetical protein
MIDVDLLESPANETLGVENSISWVHGRLIFCSITNQTLLSGEGDVRRSRSVALY